MAKNERDRLIKLREALGYSNEQFAEKLGYTNARSGKD